MVSPIEKLPSVRLESDADVEKSCNCCNNNFCESDCCFPFFRRRRRNRCPEHELTVVKTDEVAKQKIPKKEGK